MLVPFLWALSALYLVAAVFGKTGPVLRLVHLCLAGAALAMIFFPGLR